MELYMIGGFIILLIGFIFMYFLVIPLSFLISCAQSKLSVGAKALWILLMLVLWPIGAFIYGLFAPTKFFGKFVSLSCFVITILMLGGLWYALPKVLEGQVEAISYTMQELETVGMSGSLPEARANLQSALSTLADEVEEGSFLDFSQIQINGDLHAVLQKMIADQKLTPSELQSWMEKFRSRHLLDHEALQDFLEDLRE